MQLPKLFTTLRSYNRRQFVSDAIAGVIVGIVALPLAIAFGIASGVSPQQGLITAIVAGFLISVLGGSRVQIGGPTGAFIVIVYGIVQEYGVTGLTIATLIGGILLVLAGLLRLGTVIKFIPYPLIVGFTTGIAIVIFSSQIKDFMGLAITSVPAEFISKWSTYISHVQTINYYAAGVAVFTVVLTVYFGKITHRVPGSIVAIILSTTAVVLFKIPVETIGSRFGTIHMGIPTPSVHALDLSMVQHLIRPAFTIAILGAIESLLSAVVADGMIGGNHRSNIELVAQGIANIGSSIFGGIPATGAIARTATNVKNGGRTPIAGMIHSLTLLILLIFAGQWIAYIPMACLAGILVVVAYNMSEWRSFVGLLRGPREDAIVLISTCALTIFVDLTTAIEIGLILAAFLFTTRIAKISNVDIVTQAVTDEDDDNDPQAIGHYTVPAGVEVFEIKGPFFFGAAYKFKEAIAVMEKSPGVLIIRMRFVPIIDATAINILARVCKDMKKANIAVILSGVQPKMQIELEKAGIFAMIGGLNIQPGIESALNRAQEIIGGQSKLR
jgi:SulP family sulfate permease